MRTFGYEGLTKWTYGEFRHGPTRSRTYTARPWPGGSSPGRTKRNTLRNRTEPNHWVGAGRTESEQDGAETRNAADQHGAGPTRAGPEPGGLTPSRTDHAEFSSSSSSSSDGGSCGGTAAAASRGRAEQVRFGRSVAPCCKPGLSRTYTVGQDPGGLI